MRPWMGRIAPFLAATLLATGASASRTIVFTNVNLVPMDHDNVLTNKVVVVRDDRIAEIADRGAYDPEPSDRVIDGEGGYLIPGLSDLHVHLRNDPDDTFSLFLANGVTTIRNMDYLDGGYDHVTLREDVADGRRLGPRYLVSGPVLNPQNLPDVESVAPMLAKHAERDIRYVKVHMDLDPAVYEALLTQAESLGLTVVGHAQRSRPLKETLRLYSIAHAEEFLYTIGAASLADSAKRSEFARMVAESGVFVTPTLVIYDRILDYVIDERFERLADRPELRYIPPGERAEWLSASENFYRRQNFSADRIERTRSGSALLAAFTFEMHRAGVPLVLGTDSFGTVVPGISVHEELERLVEIGLTPYEALRTATANVGLYLAEPDIGILAEGRIADLVLLARNPLEDITATRDIRGVMIQGRWIPDTERLDMLRDIRERYADP